MTTIHLEPASTPTAGIQEAIDRLPPSGGVVELSAGTFLLRRPIFPRPNLTLRGQGASTILTVPTPYLTPLTQDTTLDAVAATVRDPGPIQPGDCITIMEPYIPGRGRLFGYAIRLLQLTDITGPTLRGTALYGSHKRPYRVDQDAVAMRLFPAIFALEASDLCLENFTIDGQHPTALVAAGIDMTDFMHAAVLIHHSPRTRIRNLNIRNWPSDGICGGGHTSDLDVSHCIVEHCAGNGFHTGGSAQGGQWSHNISRHNWRGFMFCQGNRHVICAHNLIHHNREMGIWGLDPADQFCVVSHNICHHNGWHGIEAEGSSNNIIQGNICRNNSTAAPGQYAGIYLHQAQGNLVTGNLCADDQPNPTQLQHLVNTNPGPGNHLADNRHLAQNPPTPLTV